MNKMEQYALEWQKSANYFLEHSDYQRLTKRISNYNTVLEIGCGTGQSTLTLLEAGHNVIVFEQNPYCVEMTKKLLTSKGYNGNKLVTFYEVDITNEAYVDNIIANFSFDIVICWNIGTYWDKAKVTDIIPKMLKYGLTINQIKDNPESSYSEFVIWHSCSIARKKNCAIHIVDRTGEEIDHNDDTYYIALKEEFNFDQINYTNIKSTSLSKGGRLLVTNGKLDDKEEVPIFFVSVLIK